MKKERKEAMILKIFLFLKVSMWVIQCQAVRLLFKKLRVVIIIIMIIIKTGLLVFERHLMR